MLVVLTVTPFIAAAVLADHQRFASRAGPGLVVDLRGELRSFFTYGYDKSIAGRGVTRVPEVVLHLLTAVGGTFGSFLGMQIFRHKTQKKSFRIVFWVIVAIQAVVIILLLTRR